MLMVEPEVGVARMIGALSVLAGVEGDAELARAITEAGYKTSQQSVSNYRRGEKTPPLGWVIGFVRALELTPAQRRAFLEAYMKEVPELEAFLRLWASL
jgi:hypothetical protein